MEAVLDNPLILLTDHKILDPDALTNVRQIADAEGRPLLIIAEDISPGVIVSLMDEGGCGKYLIVHPPEYGHWRAGMMDDLAILTGGEVVAKSLGKSIENVTLRQLGGAESVIASSTITQIIRGNGDTAAIKARRAQVQRQHDAAPPTSIRTNCESACQSCLVEWLSSRSAGSRP